MQLLYAYSSVTNHQKFIPAFILKKPAAIFFFVRLISYSLLRMKWQAEVR
jgi:hypothetical protein